MFVFGFRFGFGFVFGSGFGSGLGSGLGLTWQKRWCWKVALLSWPMPGFGMPGEG